MTSWTGHQFSPDATSPFVFNTLKSLASVTGVGVGVGGIESGARIPCTPLFSDLVFTWLSENLPFRKKIVIEWVAFNCDKI